MVDENYVRERIRIGEWEIEVEGNPEYVQKRIHDLLLMAGKLQHDGADITPQQLALALPDTHIETTNNGTIHVSSEPQVLEGEFVELSPKNLLDFYLAKSPQSQGDIVLTITFFYQNEMGREHLTLEDYDEAFDNLKKAAVKKPSNMKSSVRNVVDRTDLLYNPERGVFALTLQGEHYVKNMRKEEEV